MRAGARPALRGWWSAKCRSALLVAVLAGLTACSHVGPRTVARDRFDYTGALSDSWKQQMLYNMVKIRYGDTPVFLDVVSVINQYGIETDINVSASWQAPQGLNSNTLAVGGTGRYLDRPTISYMPLSGEKFTRSLMKPIPPPAILSMVQAGYPVDVVFRTCVNTINGIRNRYGGAARAHPADPEFYPLLERLRRIQDSGAVSLRVQKTGEMEGTSMVFRSNTSVDEDTLYVRKALGLDPAGQEFRVTYGSIARDNKEIAILSRSMLEIIVDLASYIEVPAVHVQEKRVNPTMPEETAQGAPVLPLIRVKSSPDKYCDAFISVSYRGNWFWIDDRDLRSKTLFSFLMFLFSLTETGGKEGAPIITIPAG